MQIAARMARLIAGLLLITPPFPSSLGAGERPYFVTYDHHMEEPGNLEISINPVIGIPKQTNSFLGSTTELEYGLKGWWTTEFYLDAQATRRDSALFTGWRWENRFRPLMREHWLNPVIYVEFEDLNAADKTLKEVVGFGPEEEHAEPNSATRQEREREVEAKLILSSNFRGWNVSENFIAEKNLSNEPWEFGYAFGVSRPLVLEASPRPCNLCRENFRAGLEFFGGLGTWHQFGFAGPSHYLAPVLAWELPKGTTLRVSPAFGLSQSSHRALIRFSLSHEVPDFGNHLRRWFR